MQCVYALRVFVCPYTKGNCKRIACVWDTRKCTHEDTLYVRANHNILYVGPQILSTDVVRTTMETHFEIVVQRLEKKEKSKKHLKI